MRNTATKSLANQFGITQKNLSNNPSQGIGLNPNLNIQDEYIQNLLKQIHFLNMQIKLIKQKQKQNKGLGIMGLLNKDKNPVVTHAITSNDKFSQMKKNLDNLVNNAQMEYLKLDDQNFAVKAEKDYLQKLNLKQEQKNIQNKLYIENQLNQGIAKLKNDQNKLQQIRQQYEKMNDNHLKLKQQYQDINIKDKSKQLLKTIIDNLENQTSTLNTKHHQNNTQQYNIHKSKLDQADIKFRQDPKFTQLTEQNGKLKQQVKKLDKDLFDISYRVKQMQQLKKLCIRNKDVQSQLKKQAGQEMQRLKRKLDDKKNQFENKLTQNKNGLDNDDGIRTMKGKIARKDKQSNDVKKKTDISENNYKKLRDEVMRLQVQLEQRKKINAAKQEEIKQNTTLYNESDSQMRACELEYEKNQNQIKNSENQFREARKRLESLQQQYSYLVAKEQYLNKSIDMDEGLRQVKIEQLTNLIQSNLGLNNTITDLMGKWQQIIKFSREPPAPP